MSSQKLVIADHKAARVYSSQGGHVTDLTSGVYCEHAGFLSLGDGGWAFVDDRAGSLVVRAADDEQRHPVAIPAEHLAADPTGRYLVVSTGLGANPAPWSDVVTVVDRQAGEAVRFRNRVGEPGALIAPDQVDGSLHIVLRHRQPGAIEALPLADCLSVGAHVPLVTGHTTAEVAPDGHGDIVDVESGIIGTATSRGLERFVIDAGRPRPLGIVAPPVPGRGYYLRLDPATRSAVGVLRGGPTAVDRWAEWTNALVEIDLATGASSSVGLPRGLAFRFGIGGRRVAVATIHPEGDTVTIIERSGGTLHPIRSVPLPAMARPPMPGRAPWDPCGQGPAQRRAIAVDPTGRTVAVSRGGHGEVHLITDGEATTLTVPTDLDEGGGLFWPGADPDPVGR